MASTITIIMETGNCKFCNYKWKSRVNSPKSCPRCKRRFDYYEASYKIIDLRKMLEEVSAE